MIVHICINIFSHRKLPDTVIQHQITIQMLLSLLLLWHIILSLSLSLPSCFHFVKPLFLFIRSLLFRSQPFVSLWAGLKSTSRGCVCGWGRPTTCRTLYWKGVLYFSRGQQAVCTCLCLYSFFFFLFFSVDESKQSTGTTKSQHRRSELPGIRSTCTHSYMRFIPVVIIQMPR